MSESTIVTPRGWWDLADAQQFYPSDLPTEWQLAYFANEFRATLVPLAAWSAAGATCRQWRGDVPEAFRFVAEAPRLQSTASEDQTEMQALEQALDGRLAAWLAPMPNSAADIVGELPTPRWSSWRPGADRSAAASDAAEVPSALHADLRAARRWLSQLSDQLGRPPRVLILACPTSLALQRWQELLDLLGLS
jgi:hypothetical protein